MYKYALRATSALHRATAALARKSIDRRIERAVKAASEIQPTYERMLKLAEELRDAQNKAINARAHKIAKDAAACATINASAVPTQEAN